MAAAISVEVSLDELRKFVPKFMKASTMEIGNELKRQARLLVRDDNDNGLLGITPPKTKEQGEAATRRDINRVFVTVSAIRAILAESGVRGARAAFNRYMKPGPDYSEARALDYLNNQTPTLVEVRPYTTKNGKRVRSYTQTRQVSTLGDPRLGRLQYVADSPSRALHKQKRNSRGQVRQAYWSQLVKSKGDMTNYTNQIVNRVGLLKAGWGKAARQAMLGLNLPPFVNRNLGQASGQGRASFANPLNMFIELSNQTPNASSKIAQGAVNFALRLRQENIQREMEKRLGGAAKAA
jgi:hypothetical protein